MCGLRFGTVGESIMSGKYSGDGHRSVAMSGTLDGSEHFYWYMFHHSNILLCVYTHN